MWMYNDRKREGGRSGRGNASYGNRDTFSGGASYGACGRFAARIQHQQMAKHNTVYDACTDVLCNNEISTISEKSPPRKNEDKDSLIGTGGPLAVSDKMSFSQSSYACIHRG